MTGFYIKKLMITGRDMEDAIIKLEKGLNVINGPSNTGKSYILQCIDYMFGAQSIKKIPELMGYEKVYLEIRSFDDNQPTTLLRLITNNKMYYSDSTIEEFDSIKMKELKVKHNPDSEDNISKFLLNKIGINKNKVLVTNASGSKKTLGFRGIANLSLINETKIIVEDRSPIYDTENINNTYCKSIFRYLLTQKDDNECEEIEKKEIRKAKIEAKIEYITKEIDIFNEEKSEIVKQLEEMRILPNIDKYESEVSDLEEIIKEKQKKLKIDIEKQDKANFQRNKICLLLDKFQILEKQYNSDLQRLSFIEDGSQCLNQIQINYCPLCDNKIDFDDETLDVIKPTCEKEKEKIKKNLGELKITIDKLNIENKYVMDKIKKYENYIEDNSNEISNILSNELNPLKKIISNTIKFSNLKNKEDEILENISRKKTEVVSLNESKKAKQPKLDYDMNIDQDIYIEFCKVIEDILIDWKYNDIENVKFDEKEQDIIINSIERKSNGKGYRAFFYSAFSVALINYLLNKGYPYTHILVLDSPITTLKEEDIVKGNVKEGDIIELSLQDSMFIALAKDCEDKQVIIIENKEVPKQLKNKCNHIVFTKEKGMGRYGFFPLKY